jgi:hypothetical protein
MRDQGIKWQLVMGAKMMLGEALRYALELEPAEIAYGLPVRLH